MTILIDLPGRALLYVRRKEEGDGERILPTIYGGRAKRRQRQQDEPGKAALPGPGSASSMLHRDPLSASARVAAARPPLSAPIPLEALASGRDRMLHGELDTQTPLALARELDAPHQTLVTIPYGTHAAVLSSPVRPPGAPSCGTQILASFAKNPRGRLDTACLDDLVTPFELDPQFKQQLFGNADLWENAPTP